MARRQAQRRGGCAGLLFKLVIGIVVLYLAGALVGPSTGLGAYDKYSTNVPGCQITPPPLYLDLLFHIFWPMPEDYSAAVATAYAENGTYGWNREYDNGGGNLDVGPMMINLGYQKDRVGGMTWLIYLPPVNLWIARQIWEEQGHTFRTRWYGPGRCAMPIP